MKRCKDLDWQDSYSVNVRAMDAQHKKLFELLNELRCAIEQGRAQDVSGKIIGCLMEYTAYHFSAEEKLLEKYKFAGLPTHRGEHRVLQEKVEKFKQEFDAGNFVAASDLEKFLQRWLTRHIQTVDQRYSSFLNGQGID